MATSPLALPYPTAADAPNGPAQIQALAEAVQSALGSVAAPLQEGVIDAGSFEVTQASGGASLTLDIASNVGSGAFVDDDGLSPARVGRYYVPPTASKSTVAVGTADASNPRVDRVVVSTAGVVSLVAGTATSGATLDNLTGAASVPSDSLLLADVLVPATDTTISNSQIRDRRKWARGAYAITTYTGTPTETTGVLTLVDPTNLQVRVECSGAPLRLTLKGYMTHATANAGAQIDWFVDGASANRLRSFTLVSSGFALEFDIEANIVPSAGSHLIGPAWANGNVANTLSMLGGTSVRPIEFTVEEIVRQNTKNNATTTG